MRIRILLAAALLLGAVPAAASGWEKTADLGLTFSQSGYSSSWAGDEKGTMTWNFTGNMTAARPLSENLSWKNELKLNYGQTHVEEETADGDKRWAKPQKSADRIFLESLLRFDLHKFVEPYAALTFDSQFHDGDDNPLSPAMITESAGFGRQFQKDDRGGLFSRLGFALRHETAYRVAGTTAGGLEWVTDFDRTFGEGDLKVVSKLRVFQAFFNSMSDELKGLVNEDYWESPDITWETSLSAAVSKYIQTTFFVEFLYDKEIDMKGRYREVIGLGVSYKLF